MLRYAERHHTAVSTPDRVRLSDEDLVYIDQLVADGKAKNSADAAAASSTPRGRRPGTPPMRPRTRRRAIRTTSRGWPAWRADSGSTTDREVWLAGIDKKGRWRVAAECEDGGHGF